MPATVKKPRRGQTPPSQAGQLGGGAGRQTAIAGNPPAETMDSEAPNAKRQGGSPLRFDFTGLPPSEIGRRPPLNPLSTYDQFIDPSFRGGALQSSTKRLLATLPPATQRALAEGLARAQIAPTDTNMEQIHGVVSSLTFIGGPPTGPLFSDLINEFAPTLGLPGGGREIQRAEEIAETTPPPTESEDLWYPTLESEQWTPEEDFQEAEQEE